MTIPSRLVPCLAAAAVLISIGGAAQAQTSVDFESAPGSNYDLYYGAAQSTDVALSATHSILLGLPADSGQSQQLIRVVPSGYTLGNIQASVSAYLPVSGSLAPYVEFGVDANHNGIWDPGVGGDALVIAFISGGGLFPGGSWFQTGLDPTTNVHVVDGRPGLAAGSYDASGTQDTLASLNAVPIGDGSGLSWGDLSVMRVYVADGEWPGISTFTSYVDNLSIDTVPEPASMALLGMGLAGLGLARRRRANSKN